MTVSAPQARDGGFLDTEALMSGKTCYSGSYLWCGGDRFFDALNIESERKGEVENANDFALCNWVNVTHYSKEEHGP